jgi:hypothetical protein
MTEERNSAIQQNIRLQQELVCCTVQGAIKFVMRESLAEEYVIRRRRGG